jgi:hypothetical protein
MEELGETKERKLNELTKLSVGQIRRCKIIPNIPGKISKI